MKTTKYQIKLLAVTLAAIGTQWLGFSSAKAQEIYHAAFSAVGVSTNGTGLVYHPLNSRDLIKHCASESGITNLSGLHLVYNRTADAVEVVNGTNNTLICTPLAFSNGTILSNTNGTRVERFAWVSWEGSPVANGSIVAGEHIVPATTNHPAIFSLHGQLQFTAPASGTNAPVIYIGNLSAGSDFEAEDQDDSDHED